MEYEKTKWGREIDYTSPTGVTTKLYNIQVLADELGRTPQTIRKWEIGGIIPPTPFKQNGRRLYSKEQIDAIVKCAESSHIKQGSMISSTAFVDKVLREFKKINDLYFKTEEK